MGGDNLGDISGDILGEGDCRPKTAARLFKGTPGGARSGEHPGGHNHQDFPKSTAIQMQGVLQYKWEAYCDTNGRSTDSISLYSERKGTKSTAIQIGGVLQYKLEVYRDTFLKSSGGWGF